MTFVIITVFVIYSMVRKPSTASNKEK